MNPLPMTAAPISVGGLNSFLADAVV